MDGHVLRVVRAIGAITAVVGTLALVAGCGSSNSGNSRSTSTPGTAQATTHSSSAISGATTPVSTHPGCGKYCQQAGAPAGSAPPGYPCPQAGCFKCPASQCAALLTAKATVKNGVFDVRMRCQLSSTCQGVFLLCFPDTLCVNGAPDGEGDGGRLAASDFTLSPNQTADIPIAVSALGQQFASLRTGFEGQVLVDLRNYGIVAVGPNAGFGASQSPSGASFQLRTADAGYRPPGGAVASCGGTVLAGANTSCPFARAVQSAYMRSSVNAVDQTVRAFSPVTHMMYTMLCVGDSPHVCTGGSNSRAIFY